MTSRRDLFRLAVGAGLSLAALGACGAEKGATTTSPSATPTDPLAPPEPVRTPTPDAPPRRLLALSSADLLAAADAIHKRL